MLKYAQHKGVTFLWGSMKEETAQIGAAPEAGTDAVMDLIVSGDIDAMRRETLAMASMPVGTLPLFQALGMARARRLFILSHNTGRDFGIPKGILLVGFIWLLNNGIMAPLLGFALLYPMNYSDLIFSLVRHLAFGSLSAALLLYFFWPSGKKQQT